ncbi:MAG: DUF1573 domain-containing protein [Opitutaceae bacterium]|nr:DUF1573 domain-containing protein [Opitutaceae bacterium]
MTRKQFWASIVVWSVLLHGTVRALEWKTKVFEVTTAPFQSIVDAAFEFRNTSHQTVAILAVDSTCDCVIATRERDYYGPGETGRINTRFTIGDRVGLYERAISVQTDDDPAHPVRLILRVTVPELIDIAPRLIYWHTGEAVAEKTLDVNVSSAVTLSLDGVQSMTQSFAVRLETIAPGRNYRLHITPHSTAQPASDALRIHGTARDGRAVVFSAYAYVK